MLESRDTFTGNCDNLRISLVIQAISVNSMANGMQEIENEKGEMQGDYIKTKAIAEPMYDIAGLRLIYIPIDGDEYQSIVQKSVKSTDEVIAAYKKY